MYSILPFDCRLLAVLACCLHDAFVQGCAGCIGQAIGQGGLGLSVAFEQFVLGRFGAHDGASNVVCIAEYDNAGDQAAKHALSLALA